MLRLTCRPGLTRHASSRRQLNAQPPQQHSAPQQQRPSWRRLGLGPCPRWGQQQSSS
jgi:hypothetical protein